MSSVLERATEEAYANMAKDVAQHCMRVIREAPLDGKPVDIARYPHLDASHYERCTSALAAKGFRVLRDVDASALVEPGSPPPIVRVLLDGPGTMSAAVMHVAPKNPGFFSKLLLKLMGRWQEPRLVEIWTYFRDVIIVTTSSGDLNVFHPPPWMKRRELPLGASVEALVDEHTRAVEAHRKSNGEEPRAFLEYDDLDAAREENRQRMNAWRREVGGLLPDELDRILGPHGETGRRIRPHLEKELAARVAVMR